MRPRLGTGIPVQLEGSARNSGVVLGELFFGAVALKLRSEKNTVGKKPLFGLRFAVRNGIFGAFSPSGLETELFYVAQ